MNIVQTCNTLFNREELDKYIDLIKLNGINSIRMNLCKYSFNEYNKLADYITSVINDNTDLEFVIDIPYPYNKVRISDIRVEANLIKKNKEYLITCDQKVFLDQSSNAILMEPFNLRRDISCNDIIYFGDGDGAFKIINIVHNNQLRCIALNDFEIYTAKSISLGYVDSNQSVLELVKEIYKCNKNVYFALSFVETENQLIYLDGICQGIKMIAKLETALSINNLHKIITWCEGVMIARGDLIYQIEYSDLAQYCRKICTISKQYNKRIFMATDNILSLSDRYLPSRADLIDISFSNEIGCTDIILSFVNLENIHRTVEIINKLTNSD